MWNEELVDSVLREFWFDNTGENYLYKCESIEMAMKLISVNHRVCWLIADGSKESIKLNKRMVHIAKEYDFKGICFLVSYLDEVPELKTFFKKFPKLPTLLMYRWGCWIDSHHAPYKKEALIVLIKKYLLY